MYFVTSLLFAACGLSGLAVARPSAMPPPLGQPRDQVCEDYWDLFKRNQCYEDNKKHNKVPNRAPTAPAPAAPGLLGSLLQPAPAKAPAPGLFQPAAPKAPAQPQPGLLGSLFQPNPAQPQPQAQAAGGLFGGLASILQPAPQPQPAFGQSSWGQPQPQPAFGQSSWGQSPPPQQPRRPF